VGVFTLKIYILFLLVAVTSFNASAARFVQFDESQLNAVKASIADGSASKATKNAYKRLLKDADKLLESPNYSVVDKTILPPNVDKHDFLSISSYWWPDTSKADGLPWVRKEGSTNPDTKSDKVDRNRINDMAKTVLTLSQAYYFSGQAEYAQKASTMLKVWFLANKTRMNPHLQHAQSVPGLDKTSSSGVLDGRLIPHNILDSVSFIRDSGYWSERFDQVMNQWLSRYLEWLTKSRTAQKAAKKDTRHGSWYYYQTTALAWYLNDQKLLSKQLKGAKANMLSQFNSKGGLPNELKRSKAFADSCFNLDALTSIAVIADKANKKFWNIPSKKKSALGKGVNFLLAAAQQEEWQYDEKKLRPYQCIDVFSRYAEHSQSAEIQTAVSDILSNIANKKKKSGDERRAYNRYALTQPELVEE